MNVNDIFPSKYLRGGDLAAPVTVTIASVTSERMYKPGVGETTGYVLHCEKAKKGVVLTRPLALGIAQALGEPDTDKWQGKQVTLYPEPMRVAGRDLIAIRARAANGRNGA
jgi:hypothetical protein